MPSFINRPGVVKALKAYSVVANPAKTAQQAARVGAVAKTVKSVASGIAAGKKRGIPASQTLGRYAGNIVRSNGGSEAMSQMVASATSKLIARGADAFNDRRGGTGMAQKASRLGHFLADQAGHPSKPGTLPQTFDQWKKEGPIETPRTPYSAPNRQYGEN